MLMRIRRNSVIFVTYLLAVACSPNIRDKTDVETQQESASPSGNIAKPNQLNTPKQGFERLTFQIQIPIYLPEGSEVNAEARILALACSPAVGIIQQSAEVINPSNRQVNFQIRAESYSYDLNCKNLVIVDAKQQYYESEIREMIRIPKEDLHRDDIASGSKEIKELQVTVGFQPVALPKSSLIEKEIARDIANQENEKQRLEREAAKALAHKEEIDQKMQEIDKAKTRLSEVEKALEDEQRRAIELEQIANQSLIKRIEAEKQLIESKEEKERLRRDLQREVALRLEALDKLQEKENQLSEERSRTRDRLTEKKAALKTVELTEPQFVQCPKGSLLNLDSMICD